MKTNTIVFFFLVFLFIGFSSNAASFDTKEEDCKVLLKTRCDSCHYRTRICQVLGKKSRSSWRRTMKTMIRYGVKLTKAQQKILVDCLYKAPKKAEFVCVQPAP